MRDDRLRFLDMVESIREIEKYTVSGKQAFERDELIQVWVLHHLPILREAARGVSAESQQKFHRIPGGRSSVSAISSSITILPLIPMKSGQSCR
jgi:uncharacterized protein with HEPN domain